MEVFFDYLGLVLYNIIGNNYMEDLKQLRQQINDIDQEMVKLFERRMKVSSKIGQFKRENNLPIYDKKREEQVLKRNCSLLKDTSLNDYWRIFQNQLMDLSKQYQNEINCERNTINIILDKCGYNITIDDNLINDINKVFYLKRKVLFIYDDNLSEEVVEKVSSQIDKCYPLPLHASEKQKNIETLTVIYDTLIQNCFNRNDCILCLSGGLISDIAALAASSFNRGIDLYLMPTTLLSMVDSSIGGKTAINYGGYKNMIGTFYQPKAVLICPCLLKSLPQRQFNNGLFEIIKMALIKDKNFFYQLYNRNDIDIYQLIHKSIMIKKEIIQQDEKDNQLRKILNFGHTIGHGLELNCLDLYHGEAVGYGMLCMCSDEVFACLNSLLMELLPKRKLIFDKEKVRYSILHDKKAKDNKIECVFVSEIGKCQIKEFSIEEIMDRLETLMRLK